MGFIQRTFLETEDFLREYLDENEYAIDSGNLDPYKLVKGRVPEWGSDLLSIYIQGENQKPELLIKKLFDLSQNGSLTRLKYETLRAKQENGKATTEYLNARSAAVELKRKENEYIEQIATIMAVMQSVRKGVPITGIDTKYLASKKSLKGIETTSEEGNAIISRIMEEKRRQELKENII